MSPCQPSLLQLHWWQVKISLSSVCLGRQDLDTVWLFALCSHYLRDYCPAYCYLNLHPLRRRNILSAGAQMEIKKGKHSQWSSQTNQRNRSRGNFKGSSELYLSVKDFLMNNICNFLNDLSAGLRGEFAKLSSKNDKNLSKSQCRTVSSISCLSLSDWHSNPTAYHYSGLQRQFKRVIFPLAKNEWNRCNLIQVCRN